MAEKSDDIVRARERLSFLQGVEMMHLSERELAEMDDLLALLDRGDSPRPDEPAKEAGDV